MIKSNNENQINNSQTDQIEEVNISSEFKYDEENNIIYDMNLNQITDNNSNQNSNIIEERSENDEEAQVNSNEKSNSDENIDFDDEVNDNQIIEENENEDEDERFSNILFKKTLNEGLTSTNKGIGVINKNINVENLLNEAAIKNIQLFSSKIIKKPKASSPNSSMKSNDSKDYTITENKRNYKLSNKENLKGNNEKDKLKYERSLNYNHHSHPSHHPSQIHKKNDNFYCLSKETEKETKKKYVELELYEDALRRWSRLKKAENNIEKEALITSSKQKISEKSYEISIFKVEKQVNDVFSYVIKSKTDKFQGIDKENIDFYDLGEGLYRLNLFRFIFDKDYSTTYKNDSTSKKDYYKHINTKRNEKEIIFLEQLWFILNPEQYKVIRVDTIKEFIKILFSPLIKSQKEIVLLINKFLQASYFLSFDYDYDYNHENNNENDDENEIFKENQENQPQDKVYLSPFDKKRKYLEEEIWSIETLIKEFLYMKETIIAYHHIKNQKNQKKETKTKAEEDKERQSNTIRNLKKPSKNTTFEERNKLFSERRMKKIEKIKKEKQISQMFNCTFRPNLNKNNNLKRKIKKETSPCEEKNESEAFEKKKSIRKDKFYDRLFKIHIEKSEKLKKDYEKSLQEREKQELKECSFQPQVKSYIDYNVFDNKMEKDEFERYERKIQQMREGIIMSFEKKYKLEK